MKSKILIFTCFLLNNILLTNSSFQIGLINDVKDGLQPYVLKAFQYLNNKIKSSKINLVLINNEIKVPNSEDYLITKSKNFPFKI